MALVGWFVCGYLIWNARAGIRRDLGRLPLAGRMLRPRVPWRRRGAVDGVL